MSFEAWGVFALFWAAFVTTPGPNAVNCIETGFSQGLPRGLWGVAGILTQAALFLALSALGVAAMLASAPAAYAAARLVGAMVLIWLGLRGLLAARPAAAAADRQAGRAAEPARRLYARAFWIAAINAKSLAGYLAAFTQFVQPGVPLGRQMWAIVPTALSLTAASYTGWTALGALLGRSAMGVVLNLWFRRAMGVCFIGYGLALGAGAPAW